MSLAASPNSGVEGGWSALNSHASSHPSPLLPSRHPCTELTLRSRSIFRKSCSCAWDGWLQKLTCDASFPLMADTSPPFLPPHRLRPRHRATFLLCLPGIIRLSTPSAKRRAHHHVRLHYAVSQCLRHLATSSLRPPRSARRRRLCVPSQTIRRPTFDRLVGFVFGEEPEGQETTYSGCPARDGAHGQLDGS